MFICAIPNFFDGFPKKLFASDGALRQICQFCKFAKFLDVWGCSFDLAGEYPADLGNMNSRSVANVLKAYLPGLYRGFKGFKMMLAGGIKRHDWNRFCFAYLQI